MKNLLESPNFSIAMVMLATVFAFASYDGVSRAPVGMAIGSSIPDGEQPVDVMTFDETHSTPIVGDPKGGSAEVK